MSRPKGPRTIHGLELIAAGHPLRVAARLAGVDKSTLTRARFGLPALRKGRPAKLLPRG